MPLIGDVEDTFQWSLVHSSPVRSCTGALSVLFYDPLCRIESIHKLSTEHKDGPCFATAGGHEKGHEGGAKGAAGGDPHAALRRQNRRPPKANARRSGR